MPNFIWRGKNRAGQKQEGVLLADSRDAAVATLRRQQIQVVNVREKGKEIPFLPRLPMRVKQKRVAIFTRQFSVMLDAGLPLVQCLEILGEQEENKKFQEIINTRRRSDVESGSSLHEAMRKHPHGVRQPVRQHGRRRRGRRYPGRHPAAPGDLSRESRSSSRRRSSRR